MCDSVNSKCPCVAEIISVFCVDSSVDAVTTENAKLKRKLESLEQSNM